MLFGYPIAAIANNWLHEAVCAMLDSVHDAANSGKPSVQWKRLVLIAGQPKLQARTGLRSRMLAYQRKYRRLNGAGKAQLQRAIREQNAIEDLLSGKSDCDLCPALPSEVQLELKNLFEFCFDLLADFGSRDAMYKCIYDAIPEKLCPFCGCETFDAPQAPREALDHYLPKATYPFASANLKNLVPMGTKCNSRYKLTADIVRTATGRRRAFYPYSTLAVSVSLVGSNPFPTSGGIVPDWKITFHPATEEVKTWDDVFHICTRYARDELTPRFETFLREFKNWCKQGAQVMSRPADSDVIALLRRYADNKVLDSYSDRSFLKAAVFEMLYDECSRGNGRLLTFLQDILA